jgi:small subunit ribosomal protein S9
MEEKKFLATGRRKEAIARVRLIPSGKAAITINNKPIDVYFSREDLRVIVKQPLLLTQTLEKLMIIVNVTGGGIRGQAEAIRHGISRALLLFNQALRPMLKQHKFLTRDSRMKERKKYGQEGARRRFQFSKR